MADYLPFIISGIAAGAIYGLAGSGLVLTYKTSGLFNFGHGAIATIAAYAFHALSEELGLGWGWAFVLAVVIGGPLLGLVMERIAVRLAPQRIALQIVGTVGLILAVQGLAVILYGNNPLRVRQFLPYGNETFRAFGVVVTYDLVIIGGIALVAVAALYALFRWSRIGLAMQAVVDDPDLLAMQGTDPQRVRRVSWVIGATFAALSGVLVAPLIGLSAVGLTFLVVQAFGAAAIGAFSSIPLTFLGGIVIGVASDVSKTFVLDIPWLAGLPASLPFLVLFIALLVLPKRRLAPPGRAVEVRPPPQYRAPARLRVVLAVVVLVPLLLLPTLVGPTLNAWTVALTTAILLLSLGLLVRTSGQVSLCHAAFAAIGAVGFAQLHVELGLPWLLSAVLGALIAVPVGALVAIPAIRLSGLFLALATFGFGILVQQLLYSQPWMFTTTSEGRAMPRPEWASTGPRFYYVVLGALVLTAVVLVLVHRGRLGRMLQGMSGSPTAVGAMGLSTNLTRLIVFCISAFLAGLAGVLLGVTRLFAVGGDPVFQPFFSLLLLAMLALAPFAEPWFALVAVAGVIPAYVSGADTVPWLNVFFGVFAVQVAMAGGTPPMPRRLQLLLDRLGGRTSPAAVPPASDGSEDREPLPLPLSLPLPADRTGLTVQDLRVRFGGLTAVDGLTFQAPTGRITGLIGPNGAGKTTTFDACSGLNRRFEGRVGLHGRDVTAASPPVRGRLGLGRTFQRMSLCESLTVLDNVILGHECAQAGAGPLSQLAASRSAWQQAQRAAAAAMDLCGITELSAVQVGSLSTGQRRLVELARCLAGPFDVLLLDEASSGLDPAETARLGDILVRVTRERGIGILLVEHDMELVMEICSYIYVLDFGRLIFRGTPEQVATSPVVQGAYLGDPAAVPAAPSTAGLGTGVA